MDIKDRKIAAIIATACSDAAVQPLMWIYDVNKLKTVIAGKDDVFFFEPSANPFFRVPLGSGTCYSDQALVILESLVEKKGVNLEDLKERTYKFFGPDSTYDLKNQEKQSPQNGPWNNACVKHFIENVQKGNSQTGSATDQQVDGVCKLAPVVALYAGRPDFLQQVESVVRLTQEDNFTVEVTMVYARILEQFILHGTSKSVLQVVEEITEALSKADDPHHEYQPLLKNILSLKEKDHVETCLKNFKTHCGIPVAFQGGLHGLLTSSNLQSGVKQTMMAGGNSVARAIFIGTCHAARVGLTEVPESWTQKTLNYQKFLDLSKKLVNIELA